MYSISTNFYPENKESMVGYIEAVTGVGLIMGPLIGSFLFAIGGYKFIFYSFGFLFLISSCFVKAIFPASVDRINGDSVHSSSEQKTQNSSNKEPEDDFF